MNEFDRTTALNEAATLMHAVEQYDETALRASIHYNSTMPLRYTTSSTSTVQTIQMIQEPTRNLPDDLFDCLREEEHKLLGTTESPEIEETNDVDMMELEQDEEVIQLPPPNTTTSTTTTSTNTTTTIATPQSCPPPLRPQVSTTSLLTLYEHVRFLYTPSNPPTIPPETILYYCQSAPRLLDNTALTYALHLARQHQLPIFILIVLSPNTISGKYTSDEFLKATYSEFAVSIPNKCSQNCNVYTKLTILFLLFSFFEFRNHFIFNKLTSPT
jgi:hypothetical protein